MEHIIPWVFAPSFVSAELVELILTSAKTDPNPQNAHDYNNQLQALCEFNSEHWLNAIKVPVLLIGSKEDKVAPIDDSIHLLKHIPNAYLRVLEGGHASQIEQPDTLNKFIFDFCKSN